MLVKLTRLQVLTPGQVRVERGSVIDLPEPAADELVRKGFASRPTS
jgi:hypothetical protein